MIQVDGIFVQQGGGGPVIPDFSYTGEYQLVHETEGNWRLYLITSGTFTPSVNMLVDICLFGGGQGGENGTVSYSDIGTGGIAGHPGGSNTQKNVVLQAGNSYSVEIGSGGASNLGIGGATIFDNISANGGASNNGSTDPAPEFGEDGNPTQAAKGGAGGTVQRYSATNGEAGGNAGSTDNPENGGSGGSSGFTGGGENGEAGSRGAGGGLGGSASASARGGGGGGGGGGFGASGGGGGGVYGAYSGAGSGGVGAPGVAILRNARGAAA